MQHISLDNIERGTYVVAVSGGVDSVVLLDMLAQASKSMLGFKFVVAHFDHGIRADSKQDAKFVAELAKKYGFLFELGEGQLDENASEADARRARYDFLQQVLAKHKALAIITAHHQDDLIETAIINILRGTGRRGLSSLKSRRTIWRPLLGYTKHDLMRYAADCKLDWREDSTNADPRYLRNFIRLKLLPKANAEWSQQFLQRIKKGADLNEQIEHDIISVIQHRLVRQPGVIARRWFIHLPHEVAAECMVAYLRKHQVADIDSKLIDRLVVAVKAGRVGSRHDINGQHFILITKRSARFMDQETSKTHKIS